VIDGGALHGIDYTLPVPSAQVKSAVLLAGLGAEGATVVREPVPTRAHTEELLAACGADMSIEGGVVTLRPSALHPFELDVPGDPSQAAFWVVAAAIVPGSILEIENVYIGPARAGFLDVLARMGARIDVDGRDIHVRHAPLHATEVGGDEVPGLIDEIPVLAVAAACAEGTTVFRDAGELRVKESDRIATVVEMLTALGAQAEPTDDGLVVTGPARLHGASIDSHGDHRVAMSAAIAGLVADGPVHIERFDAVATSYPRFEEDLLLCVS
jgi:3-phosphoshikimate 1-carboxyvinyltransferase